MPPILMILIIIFSAIMLMVGESPVEQWKREQLKYGKDPLARDIAKFNEKNEKDMGGGANYTPPAGSTVYRMPADQVPLAPKRSLTPMGGEEELVHPAPEIPIEQWGSGYPNHMMAPKQGSENDVVAPANTRGTSLMPATGGP